MLTTPGSGTDPEPPPGHNDSQGLTKLLEDLEQIRNRHDVPAVALTIVSSRGTIATAVLGVADRKRASPATPDTMFRIGSITKTFTALAVMQAREHGLLDLDSRITRLTPDTPIVNPWKEDHPVRLVHLLEHTAGLLDLDKAEFDHNLPVGNGEGLRVAPERRVARWPPGMHASYSNAGYGLAGYALERATGTTWSQIMREWLFVPMGMPTASASPGVPAGSMLATGYDTDGHRVIPYWHMIMPSFGAINASAREMGALPKLFLNDGRVDGKALVSETAIRRMEHPTSTLAAQEGLSWGYGLGVYASSHRGFVFYGHGGDGDGYLSRFGYSRQLDRGYFVVINTFQHAALREIRDRILDHLVAGSPPPRQRRVPDIGRNDLAQLAGRYRPVTWRFPWQAPYDGDESLRVEIEGDRILVRSEGERRELVPVTHRLFRFSHEPEATMAFIPLGESLYFQSDEGNYVRIEADREGKSAMPGTPRH